MENFLNEDWLFVVVMVAAVALFLSYQVYNRYMSLKTVEQLLKDYYGELGIEVISISKLKVAEKLKYGVPLNSFVSFYTSPLKIFSALDESFCRTVETADASGKEHIRYVEINFTAGKGIKLNEFDTYEF